MTQTFSVITPSGSSNGAPIQVNGTTTGAPTVLHTTTSTSNSWDENWWWANNLSSLAISVTTQVGGTTTSISNPVTVPPLGGYFLILPGLRLAGGAVVSAYVSSAAAGFITFVGNVNRIA